MRWAAPTKFMLMEKRSISAAQDAPRRLLLNLKNGWLFSLNKESVRQHCDREKDGKLGARSREHLGSFTPNSHNSRLENAGAVSSKIAARSQSKDTPSPPF